VQIKVAPPSLNASDLKAIRTAERHAVMAIQ